MSGEISEIKERIKTIAFLYGKLFGGQTDSRRPKLRDIPDAILDNETALTEEIEKRIPMIDKDPNNVHICIKQLDNENVAAFGIWSILPTNNALIEVMKYVKIMMPTFYFREDQIQLINDTLSRDSQDNPGMQNVALWYEFGGEGGLPYALKVLAELQVSMDNNGARLGFLLTMDGSTSDGWVRKLENKLVIPLGEVKGSDNEMHNVFLRLVYKGDKGVDPMRAMRDAKNARKS